MFFKSIALAAALLVAPSVLSNANFASAADSRGGGGGFSGGTGSPNGSGGSGDGGLGGPVPSTLSSPRLAGPPPVGPVMLNPGHANPAVIVALNPKGKKLAKKKGRRVIVVVLRERPRDGGTTPGMCAQQVNHPSGFMSCSVQ
jgi:hypothetical protein